ncbi:MAG TPA: hypothetical protein VFT47_09295 [Vicinamibacterales bacterium]|nr:hypothetical protein [Vicinamibacterales bacterium]
MGTRVSTTPIAACRRKRWTWIVAATVALVASGATSAQAQYNSGSSGVHGVFPPAPVPDTAQYVLWNLKTGLVRYCTTYDTVSRPDTCTNELSTAQILGTAAGGPSNGVYQFTNFDLQHPSSAFIDLYPVGYDGPVPLTILSQQSIRLFRVTFHMEGAVGWTLQTGLPPTGFGPPGGRPGPGGFAGGNGGKMGTPSTDGNPGFGPTGGAAGRANTAEYGQDAGPTSVATSLIPLVGGSGGGGTGAWDTACGFRGPGGSGGGGGGALLVAANVQIVLDTSFIDARGGAGGYNCVGYHGGAGSGGSVRLVAPTVSGSSTIMLGNGIIRVEGNASAFSGYIDTVRGTVLSAPQPAIPSGIPTLRITSVGGLAVGQNPTGSIATPDVTFQTVPSGPVTVNLAASNIPIGTVASVRANPLIGTATTTDSSALTGSLQSSTASASLTIPAGAGVITAVTTFPVTTAMLDRLPQIPGMKPALIEVTADASGTSRLFVIGEDSRRVELKLGTDGRFAVAN